MLSPSTSVSGGSLVRQPQQQQRPGAEDDTLPRLPACVTLHRSRGNHSASRQGHGVATAASLVGLICARATARRGVASYSSRTALNSNPPDAREPLGRRHSAIGAIGAVTGVLGLCTPACASNARTAPEIVRALWASQTDFSEVEAQRWAACFAEDCIYEDLYYETPFKGRKALVELLRLRALPQGSKLVVDRISDGKLSCGFTWHIEKQGSGVGLRGLGYVRVGEDGLVRYVRDLAEPVFKAGVLTEQLLSTLTKDQVVERKRPDVQAAASTEDMPTDANSIVRLLYGKVQQSGGDAVRFFSNDVVYEDMNYETPFVGKPAVAEFLARFQTLEGVTFNLEEVSDGKQAVGFTYTITIAGQPRGIKGATFYEVDRSGSVCYVRDVPESFAKPPPLQQLARLVQPGLRRFGPAPPLPGDVAGKDPLLQA